MVQSRNHQLVAFVEVQGVRDVPEQLRGGRTEHWVGKFVRSCFPKEASMGDKGSKDTHKHTRIPISSREALIYSAAAAYPSA
jgi:hypothetical protein